MFFKIKQVHDSGVSKQNYLWNSEGEDLLRILSTDLRYSLFIKFKHSSKLDSRSFLDKLNPSSFFIDIKLKIEFL